MLHLLLNPELDSRIANGKDNVQGKEIPSLKRSTTIEGKCSRKNIRSFLCTGLPLIAVPLYLCYAFYNESGVSKSFITKSARLEAGYSHQAARLSPNHPVSQVDCFAVPSIEPVNMGKMQATTPKAAQSNTTTASPQPQPIDFLVSFSWWESRLLSPQYQAKLPVHSNANVNLVYQLLLEEKGAFIDIGANVGFMTNLALSMGRKVYSIEPISYNVAKLCEGDRQRQRQRSPSTSAGELILYQAAVGPTCHESVIITRPSDETGYFDQTSLTRGNVNQKNTVQEHIPMVSIDSLFYNRSADGSVAVDRNPTVPHIALIKIDVQGHELGVVQGMRQLLSRANASKSPKCILYEADPRMMVHGMRHPRAPQVLWDLIQSYGYECQLVGPLGGDVLCTIQ